MEPRHLTSTRFVAGHVTEGGGQRGEILGTCSGIFEMFSYLVLLSQERVRRSCRVMVWGKNVLKKKTRLEVGRAGREQTQGHGQGFPKSGQSFKVSIP